MKKILIIGAGAMGSAFSIPCVENNNDVTIMGSVLEDDFISSIKSNKNLHPSLNLILPKNIKIEKFSEIALNKYGVALVPGKSFGDNAYDFVRISYANSLKNIEEAIKRISKI